MSDDKDDSDDLTVHILRDLRKEIRSTNQRLDATNQRLEQHIDRFDKIHADLVSRMATREDLLELELRLATRFVEQAAATRDLYDLLNANLSLRDRVERCEQDISDLKGRVL